MRLISGTARHAGDGHAVVIGSSVAGLAAAAALTNHMDRVTVIERDRLPDGPQWRPGVAQSRHAHNLMSGGHRGLERLFPGMQRQLTDAGMVSVGMSQDMLMLGPGGWMPRLDTGLAMMTGSRDVIDDVVRDRLDADSKVTFLTETEVTALFAGDGDTVAGVWARTRDAAAADGWGEARMIAAELVVDASGRKSRTPEWLTQLGYQAPTDTVVDAKTAYATQVFTPPAGHAADWKCMLLLATPEEPRQGILNPIEDGRWMVSISASGGARPPTDHDAFLEYSKTLRSTVLHEAIEHATPVGPAYGSGRTENRWRHFEKLRRWPDRFLVIGDAVAAFNPSYGQGMSVAVQSALLLDDTLRKRGNGRGVTARLQRALGKQVMAPWQIATGVDLHYTWAAEPNPPDLVTRLGMRYVDRLAAVAPTSHVATRVLLEMTQLEVSPTATFRPAVIAAALRGPTGPAPVDPPSATHGDGARRARAAAADTSMVGVTASATRSDSTN